MTKNEIKQYLYEQFPTPYENSYTRELLDNVLVFVWENTYYEYERKEAFMNLLPEITEEEVLKFLDIGCPKY